MRNEYFPQTANHPGVDLQEKLEELGIDPTTLSIRTDISKSVLDTIVQGNYPITPKITEALERALLIPAHYWLARQQSFNTLGTRS